MFRYLRIQDGEPLPDLGDFKPFKAIVVIEEPLSPEWQTRASRWLVGSGCLYMMAWGEDCGSWDDSVDYANLERFGYGDIPDDEDVMTTWHEKEPLGEVFRFAQEEADHPTVALDNLLILHLGADDRRAEFAALVAS